jgi:hypothetical protein
MPSISAITVTGKGSAISGSRSTTPAPPTRSTSSSQIRWTRGRSESTNRGVNAFDTNDRTRVWSGGSMSRMPLRIKFQKGIRRSGSGGRLISSWVATRR